LHVINRLLQERALAGRLMRLARTYRREIDRALAALGMSDARALPVLHIARLGDGVRQGQVAEDLGIEGPSLVRLLDQLSAAGVVERRDDPRDGRAKTLHLTKEGRALAEVIEDVVDRVRAELLGGVDDADLATTVQVLSVFEAAVDAAESRARGSAD
jgi:MarR family transcriptional regulator for hemolysin